MLGQIQQSSSRKHTPSSLFLSSSPSPSPKLVSNSALSDDLESQDTKYDLHSESQSQSLLLQECQSQFNDVSDSPLDFSTKKAKFEKRRVSQCPAEEEAESPCSRLRNILNMKSPACLPTEDLAGTVLNLSKESDSQGSDRGWNSQGGGSSRSISASSSSSSSSPTMDIPFVPTSRSIMVPTAPPLHPKTSVSSSVNGSSSLGFSPYGLFTPNLSPILTQGTPGSGLSLAFDPSPPLFSHVAAGSPSLPFGTNLPLPHGNNTSPSNSNGASKNRTTRPFKVPMTFISNFISIPENGFLLFLHLIMCTTHDGHGVYQLPGITNCETL